MTTIRLENISYKEEIRRKTSKPLIWIGIMSIVMFFGGLTSAVIVSQGSGEFLKITMPFAFTVSTVIIVLSSVAFHFGLISIKKGNYAIAKLSIATTLVLGLLFVVSQYLGWVSLNENGIYAAGKESTQESSFLYLITGLHVLHLIGGLISLIVVLVKIMKERYNAENVLGIQISITYWHFLGGLWIYLFFFLRYTIA
ncbi:MAG: cytochrome oxidase subunit III [Flavobacteriales bacterium]|nr:MAG: cytochrome oxidase subunit III [Flavobacteriales bacterium]